MQNGPQPDGSRQSIGKASFGKPMEGVWGREVGEHVAEEWEGLKVGLLECMHNRDDWE